MSSLLISYLHPSLRERLQAACGALWLRSGRLTWVVMGVLALALLTSCVFWRFDYFPLGNVAGIIWLTFLACLLAGAGWPRPALLFESFALGIAAVTICSPLTSICAFVALPLQDGALAAADRWLGIDWPALAYWFRDHPQITRIMYEVYASIVWQPAALMVLLAFLDPERLRRFMMAEAFVLAVTVVVFLLVPALGPYNYFNLPNADFPDVTNKIPWVQPVLIEGLRGGSHELVFDGIVSFPSYHAATAILFAFGWAGVPVIGVPLVILNMVMLVSTVPIGGHYVIDVIAGAAVALGSLRIAHLHLVASDKVPSLPTWDRTREWQIISAHLGRLLINARGVLVRGARRMVGNSLIAERYRSYKRA